MFYVKHRTGPRSKCFETGLVWIDREDGSTRPPSADDAEDADGSPIAGLVRRRKIKRKASEGRGSCPDFVQLTLDRYRCAGAASYPGLISTCSTETGISDVSATLQSVCTMERGSRRR